MPGGITKRKLGNSLPVTISDYDTNYHKLINV